MQTKYKIYAKASLGLFTAFLLAAAPLAASAQIGVPADALEATTALNWSGYVSDSGTYTQVNGSWTVPNVTTSKAMSADATWVGIGGVRSHDLIQAGTEAVPDSNGTITYQAWYELLPAGSRAVPLAVSPGDSVSVSIRQYSNDSTSWFISFINNTTGKTYSTTVQYQSSLSSAEWIEEMPAGVGLRISLDDFGTITFTNGSTVENGATETIAGSGAQPLMMQNDYGESTAIPSTLGTDGMSFTVERTAAASSSIGIGVPTYRTREIYSYDGSDGSYGDGSSAGTSTISRFRIYLEPDGRFQIQLF